MKLNIATAATKHHTHSQLIAESRWFRPHGTNAYDVRHIFTWDGQSLSVDVYGHGATLSYIATIEVPELTGCECECKPVSYRAEQVIESVVH